MSVEPVVAHTPPGPDGWVSLFDGKSMDAFVNTDGGPVSNSWTIEDGSLKSVAKTSPNSGVRTRETYRSFEMRFEWKVPPKGNSGVKYRLFYLTRGGRHGTRVSDRG